MDRSSKQVGREFRAAHWRRLVRVRSLSLASGSAKRLCCAPLVIFALVAFLATTLVALAEAQTTSETKEDNYVLVALKSGNGTWTVPPGVEKIDYLIVGGGGGYGSRGGGGAGAFYEATDVSVTPGASITYTIGTGGASGNSTSAGSNGGHTTFNGITAYGGGGGTATEQYGRTDNPPSDLDNRPVYKSSFTNGEGGSGGGGMASPKHNWNGRSDSSSGSEITALGSDDRGGLGQEPGTAGSGLFRNRGGDSQSIFFVFGNGADKSFWIGAGGGGAGEPGRDVAWVSDGESLNGVIAGNGVIINLTSTSGTAGFVPGAGGKGKASTLLSATSANTLGIGQVNGTNENFAGGGGGRANYDAGGINFDQLSPRGLGGFPGLGSVGANTGGGGTSAPGEDGVVLIRYLAPPKDFKVVPRESDFDLSWTAPDNATGLTGYEYSTDNGSNWAPTGSTSTTTTVDPGDVCSTYTFLVRAVYNSEKSAAASLTGSGCNNITILGSGGADEDSGWTAINGVITATQDVSINASDVVTYIANGDLKIEAVDIEIDAALSNSTSNSLILEARNDVFLNSGLTFTGSEATTLTVKANRHVRLKSDANITSSSAPLNAQFWADTDQDADGIIYIGSENIDTNGGHLTFGEEGQRATVGGESILVGGDVFFQRSTSAQTLTTGGGELNIYGETIVANTDGLSINSANGDITLHGLLNSGSQYTFVDKTGNAGSGSWSEARTEAKNGTPGGGDIGHSYLVNITSRLENSIAGLTANYSGAWIGAYRNDNGDSGGPEWEWADGPESGEHFFTEESAGGGSAESGYYSNFGSGEPNGFNCGSNCESVGQFFGSEGQWNDLDEGTTYSASQDTIYLVLGYVQETNLAPSSVGINAGSGHVFFDGGVGTAKALSTLNVTSASTTLVGNGVVTTGAQTYSSSLAVNSVGSSEEVRISAGSGGNGISAGGNVEIFGSKIDFGADLNTSSVNGNIFLQAPTKIDVVGTDRALNSGAGDITLITNAIGDSGNQFEITSTGIFSFQPSTNWTSTFVGGSFLTLKGALTSGNFTGDTSLPESRWLKINAIESLSGFTLGRDGSTNNIELDSPIKISGPIHVYGAELLIDEDLTSTATTGLGIELSGQRILQNNGSDVTTSGANIRYAAANFVSAAGKEDLIKIAGNGSRAVVNANGGNISLEASYAAGAGADERGRSIRLMAADLVTSASGEISLVGDATNNGSTDSSVWGMQADDARIITDDGDITMTMTGGASTNNSRGLAIDNQSLELLSDSGTITIRDLKPAGLGGSYAGLYLQPDAANSIVFGADGSEVPSSSSDIIIEANRITFNNETTRFNTSGAVSLQPADTGFDADISTPNMSVANTVSGLTIGKATNTSNITIAEAAAIAGPITIYGADIAFNAALAATNDNINLHASGAVTQTAALTADGLTLNGSGAFTLQNASNNISTLAGGDVDNRLGNVKYRDANALEIGSINPSGIFSSGEVLIETQSGDITLSHDINTTSSSLDAIIINAGRASAAGVATGGDIQISGSPTLTYGSGGQAKLFSGTDNNSTGVTQLVGGAANTRSGFDENSDLSGQSLVANEEYAIYRAAVGAGDITVVDGTGDAENSTWIKSNGLITTISATADVNASVIESALSSGNLIIEAANITVDADIDGSTNNTLTLKATGNISVTADNSVQTNGGDITFWADSDNNEAGGILLDPTLSGTTTSVQSNGGNIVLGGGVDPTLDEAVASNGIYLHQATVDAGSGNITMRGRATRTDNPFGIGIDLFGANVSNPSQVIGADIAMFGVGSPNAGGNADNWGVAVQKSLVSGTGNITIEGTGGGSNSTGNNNHGLFLAAGTVEATGGGTVNLIGTGGQAGGTSNDGIRLDAGVVRSVSGVVTLTGSAGSNANSEGLIVTGSGTNTLGDASQTGDIIIRSDYPIFSSGSTNQILGSGAFTIAPKTTSFTGPFALDNVSLGSDLTGLMLGKPGNISALSINQDVTVAGPITLYSDTILLDKALTSTDDRISLIAAAPENLTGTLELQENGSLTADELLVQNFHRANLRSNGTVSVGMLASNGGDQLLIENNQTLTIGTIGGVDGVSITGTGVPSVFRIDTTTGDILVKAPINAQATSATTIELNAGKSQSVGTASGGDIKISDNGAVVLAGDARARLFTGSPATATGLAEIADERLVFYDETSTLPTLDSGKVYAIYRQTTPDRLRLDPAPSASVASGVAWPTQPTLAIVDAFDNVIRTDDDSTITAALFTGENGTLQGTVTLDVSEGVGAYQDLRVLGPVGTSYRVRFSSPDLSAVTSEPITVTSPGPLDLSVSTLNGDPVGNLIADGQSPSLLTATLTDAFGNPRANESVVLELVETEGRSLDAATGTTNAAGQFSTTLSSTVIGITTVNAYVNSIDPANLIDSVGIGFIADEPTQIEVVSGGGQTGEVATALANPMTVRVLDAFDNVVEGASVEFVGDGTTNPAKGVAMANAEGIASIEWLLGENAGEQTLVATLPGSVPEQSVTFTATAEPGAPSQWGFALDTFKQLTTIPFDGALVLQDAYANPTTADAPVTVTVTATNQSFAENITGASDGTLAVDGVTGPVTATLPAGQTEVALTDLVYTGLSAPAAELPDIELLASSTLEGESVTGTTLISARDIQLVVVATPNEIVADGQQNSLITAALLDLNGDPIANQPVRFENTLGQLFDASTDEALEQPVVLVGDGNGEAQVRFSSTTASSATVLTTSRGADPFELKISLLEDIDPEAVEALTSSSDEASASEAQFDIDIFLDSGIEQALEENVEAYNAALGNLELDAERLEEMVLAYNTLLEQAKVGSVALSETQLAALGIEFDSVQAVVLMNDLLSSQGVAALKDHSRLLTIAQTVQSLMDRREGKADPAPISADDLTLLGLTGVTSRNAGYIVGVLTNPEQGSVRLSLPAMQRVANEAVATFNAIAIPTLGPLAMLLLVVLLLTLAGRPNIIQQARLRSDHLT